MQINTVLESPNTPEIKEQALCIIGNIAASAGMIDYVMQDERILKKLLDYIVSINKVIELLSEIDNFFYSNL